MKDQLKSRLKGLRKNHFNFKTIITAIAVASAGLSAQAQTPLCKLSVNLLLNTNGGASNSADACIVAYRSDFNPAVGPEDSYKFTNLDENLAIKCGNTLLSIDGRPPFAAYDTVALKVWQYRQTHYYFKISGSNFPGTCAAVLKDNYLQQDFAIDVAGETLIEYFLTSDTASYASDRFCIVFKPASTLAVSTFNLAVKQKEDAVQLDWSLKTDKEIERFEIEKSLNGTDYKTFGTAKSTSSGFADKTEQTGNIYYRIKMIDKTGFAAYSNVAKIKIGRKDGSISVFPNPVNTNAVAVHMLNMEKDTYKVTLINNSGQTVYTNSIVHDGGTAIRYLALDKKLAKGTYQLIMSNQKAIKSQTVVVE